MTEKTKTCPTCKGHKKIRITYWIWSELENHVGARAFAWIPCPTCNGEGTVKRCINGDVAEATEGIHK